MASERYAFRPGVDLVVRADGAARRHFAAEYGGATIDDDGTEPAVAIDLASGAGAQASGFAIDGAHKTVSWRITLGAPDATPLRATIALGGRPRRFALSLVQGYVVEPLLALAASRRGYVLLPAAAIGQDDGALVLLGASGTGKSSLSVRALAVGRGILGDDQIFIDGDACCHRFERRMRLYSDLRLTAPAAWRALPRAARGGLRARRAIRLLTRGFVAPSLPLPAAAIADPGPAGPLRARRLVLLERAKRVPELAREPVDAGAAVTTALALLEAQRVRFAATLGADWQAALMQLRDAEQAILERALARAVVERLPVPDGWDAARAIAAIAAELGTERGER